MRHLAILLCCLVAAGVGAQDDDVLAAFRSFAGEGPAPGLAVVDALAISEDPLDRRQAGLLLYRAEMDRRLDRARAAARADEGVRSHLEAATRQEAELLMGLAGNAAWKRLQQAVEAQLELLSSFTPPAPGEARDGEELQDAWERCRAARDEVLRLRREQRALIAKDPTLRPIKLARDGHLMEASENYRKLLAATPGYTEDLARRRAADRLLQELSEERADRP